MGDLNAAAAHAVTQGVITELSGGDFEDGAAAAFFGSAISSSMLSSESSFAQSKIGNLTISGITGGFVAKANDGNFWQGFATAIAVAGLNHLMHRHHTPKSADPGEGNSPDGWKTLQGIAAAAGGIVMISGGVAAAVIPGGQVLAVYLISAGVVVTGFGVATAIDGADGGTRKDLGGPGYTIDKRTGGNGYVGEAADLLMGGIPSKGIDGFVFGLNILLSTPSKAIIQNNNNRIITGSPDDFIMQPDNTRVNLQFK